MSIALSLPPDPRHIGVVRATVGAAAIRSALTLDQIDDVRLATEEAVSVLLRGEPDQITVAFDVSEPMFAVTVSGVCSQPVEVSSTSLSAVALTAMTESYTVGLDGDATVLRLRFASPLVEATSSADRS